MTLYLLDAVSNYTTNNPWNEIKFCYTLASCWIFYVSFQFICLEGTCSGVALLKRTKYGKWLISKQLSSTGYYFIICGTIVVWADTESLLLLIWFFLTASVSEYQFQCNLVRNWKYLIAFIVAVGLLTWLSIYLHVHRTDNVPELRLRDSRFKYHLWEMSP